MTLVFGDAHGRFDCSVCGGLHGGETGRVLVAAFSGHLRAWAAQHFSGTSLRIGIIGAGMLGQEHLRNIALFGEDVAVVAAVAEADVQASYAWPSRWGIASSARSHTAPLSATAWRSRGCDGENTRTKLIGAQPPGTFMVGMEYKWMPAISKLIQEVGSGDLLTLSIRVHGTEKGCHSFDPMRRTIRSEPVSSRVVGRGGCGAWRG